MFVFADFLMCCLWVAAYALALLCTLKEKKIVIPPLASAVILPWEIVAAIRASSFSYSTLGKFGWSSLHFAVFILGLFFLKKYSLKIQLLCISFFVAVLVFLSYVFTLENGMLYTSFTHTCSMMAIIVVYTITKKDYPLTMTSFYFALTAFFADIACLIRYNHFNYDKTIELFAIFLLSINITHVTVLYIRLKKANVLILQGIKTDFRSIKNTLNHSYNTNILPFLKKHIIPEQKYHTKRKYKKKQKQIKTHRKKKRKKV